MLRSAALDSARLMDDLTVLVLPYPDATVTVEMAGVEARQIADELTAWRESAPER